MMSNVNVNDDNDFLATCHLPVASGTSTAQYSTLQLDC